MTEDNQTHRIMVVEDDDNVCQGLKARLIHEGYEVSTASDAIGAVSTARRDKPNVALVDINLPGGSGFEVAQRLERVLGGTGLKIIFMTASKEPGLREKAMDVGAAAFVEKPFTAETLLSAINEVFASELPKTFG